VYCNEVADADAWPAQIESHWRAEVLNYGVGGYGTDQAFLRFRTEGTRLRPHVFVIGFTSMMATRVVSRYRRFQEPGDGPWFKPRFVLEGEALRLIPAPVASREDAERLLANPAAVAEIGSGDFWYNRAMFEHPPYRWSATYRFLSCSWFRIQRRHFSRNRVSKDRALNPESESFKILMRIFQDFAVAVRARGAEPAALMLPARGDLHAYASRGRAPYHTLRSRLEDSGLSVIDAADALTASSASLDELFAPLGHYSAMGNQIVAKALAQALHLVPRS
jgi:hypothetical protein